MPITPTPPPSGSRVLVTGASGFLGTRVVAALAQLDGVQAIPARRDGRPGSLRLDLTDPTSVRRAVGEADAIVHCAVGDRQVSVDGTRALLEAAAAAGVGRVVHLSSVAVYGAAEGAVTETTPRHRPAHDSYAAWKVEAEELCEQYADALAIVRLRPTIIYGPTSPLWIDTMLRRIASGRWGTFGSAGEGTCNPVHVDDVAGAAVAALGSGPEAVGQAFNVDGGEAMTWNQWWQRLAAEAGLPPLPALSGEGLRRRSRLALPVKAARRLLPRLDPDYLLGTASGSELALFALRATYPATAARDLLGWSPAIPLDVGLPPAVHAGRADRPKSTPGAGSGR